MDIEAFLICDSATDQFGKLNILGAFDAIAAHNVPVVHPQFSVALRIRFRKSESANHPFRINLVDADGKPVLPRPFDGNVNVQLRETDEFAVVNLIVNLRDTRFEKFGRYSVDLTMDGKQRGALPLFVKQVQREPERG
jgi:hypothetical protein